MTSCLIGRHRCYLCCFCMLSYTCTVMKMPNVFILDTILNNIYGFKIRSNGFPFQPSFSLRSYLKAYNRIPLSPSQQNMSSQWESVSWLATKHLRDVHTNAPSQALSLATNITSASRGWRNATRDVSIGLE